MGYSSREFTVKADLTLQALQVPASKKQGRSPALFEAKSPPSPSRTFLSFSKCSPQYNNTCYTPDPNSPKNTLLQGPFHPTFRKNRVRFASFHPIRVTFMPPGAPSKRLSPGPRPVRRTRLAPENVASPPLLRHSRSPRPKPCSTSQLTFSPPPALGAHNYPHPVHTLIVKDKEGAPTEDRVMSDPSSLAPTLPATSPPFTANQNTWNRTTIRR